MDSASKDDDGATRQSRSVRFVYKNLSKILAEYVKYQSYWVVVRTVLILVPIATLWAALWQLYGLGPPDPLYIFLILWTALTVAAVMGWFRYRAVVPKGFENETRQAQLLVHLQPPYWEIDLFNELMNTHAVALDERWRAVVGRRRSGAPQVIDGVPEYRHWILSRIDAIKHHADRLHTAVIAQFLDALDKEVADTKRALRIRECVNGICDHLVESIRIETEAVSVVPPTAFTDAHSHAVGWTRPLVDAALAMRCQATALRSVNLDNSETFEGQTVSLDLPPVFSTFMDEFDAAEARILNE